MSDFYLTCCGESNKLIARLPLVKDIAQNYLVAVEQIAIPRTWINLTSQVIRFQQIKNGKRVSSFDLTIARGHYADYTQIVGLVQKAAETLPYGNTISLLTEPTTRTLIIDISDASTEIILSDRIQKVFGFSVKTLRRGTHSGKIEFALGSPYAHLYINFVKPSKLNEISAPLIYSCALETSNGAQSEFLVPTISNKQYYRLASGDSEFVFPRLLYTDQTPVEFASGTILLKLHFLYTGGN